MRLLQVGLFDSSSGQSVCSALILVTPPATDPLAWSLAHINSGGGGGANSSSSSDKVVLTRSNRNTALYAQRVRDVAGRLNVPLVDLFALTDVQEEQAEQPNPYLSDGLHLSPAGNLLLYRQLLACIDQHLPHLAISQLPLDAPYHADIRPDNYEVVFSV